MRSNARRKVHKLLGSLHQAELAMRVMQSLVTGIMRCHLYRESSSERHLRPGFDRAFRNMRTAPCQVPDAEGACRLLLSNSLHYVLVNS